MAQGAGERTKRVEGDDDGDPQELAGPTDCESSPAECEVKVGDSADVPSVTVFERNDELQETFKAEPIPVHIGPDGLPEFHDTDDGRQFAPPFGPDTVVCIEDKRQYVELFLEELISRNWTITDTKLVSPLGDRIDADGFSHPRRQYNDDGKMHERRTFEPAAVENRWGFDFAATLVGSVAVRPVRERCMHYMRQSFVNDDQLDPTQAGHRLIFRVCTAKRSNGGAYLSLRDEAVYACDHRYPKDQSSVQRFLDGPDDQAILEKRHLKRLPMFGLPGHEEDICDDLFVPQGIFGGR